MPLLCPIKISANEGRKTFMARKELKPLSTEVQTAEEFQLADAHPNHENHLCHIVMLRNMRSAAKLAKDAQYICFLCGRAAKDSKNLCEPIKI